MLASQIPRERFTSTLEWARAEYARIQAQEKRYPRGSIDCEPGEKSALFARLLSGKDPLPFAPPTSFGQPWYDLIECPGPYDVLLGGTLPAWDVPNQSDTVFLEYLVVNSCPWGVKNGNDAAAAMSDLLGQLRDCTDRATGASIMQGIGECLHARPEWTVNFSPWADYRVFLGRSLRQGKRRDVERVEFFRHSLDGTNLRITRTLIDGARQAEGKAERVAHLRKKPAHLLTTYERKALADLDASRCNTSDGDWVEYESDTWMIQAVDSAGQDTLHAQRFR